ncbi:MAG: molybdenum cofactor guanylyltransferase [Bacteroidetes bacterium]|nr:molybdenum cofactor guanylyltransferase [Bacteroidota bacterium]MBU1679244.1 molybdenum cofactor guanylyltransferase [Bacteroidota bacterium]MBU2506856.1 molybdenum cofactor guanylyltransferase [Bacteroidota bacterium]
MHKDVTGIILAGGRSSRMGQNKSFLKLGDKLVIERMVDIVSSLFKDLIIITNTLSDYEFLGLPIYEDIFRYRGPIAGIHSGLKHSRTDKNFVVSCDIPLMSREMINCIVEYPTEKPVTICCAAGYIQPLAGVYSKSMLDAVDKYLTTFEIENSDSGESKNKICRMHHFLDQIEIELINPQNLPFYKDELFFNMNRPDDYEKIKQTFPANPF